MICGSARCIGDDVIHDEVWHALIEPDSTDAMTQELLQLLFHTFSVTTQRLLIDHLPNGAYYNVSERSIIEKTASVPTTNVSPERDFAVLNLYLREKPNAQLIALEAMILCTHNKTSLWMAQLFLCEREELFQAARKFAPAFKEGRKGEIEQNSRHEMEKRIKKIAR